MTVLTTEQKALLVSKQASIEASFTKFAVERDFMALYFTKINSPYVTFSNTNSFPNVIQVGRNKSDLIGVFDTKLNFVSQLNALLA